MKLFNPILILLILISASLPALAEDNQNNGPGISIGVTGIFGTNTIDQMIQVMISIRDILSVEE
jgi:hypothetical protein